MRPRSPLPGVESVPPTGPFWAERVSFCTSDFGGRVSAGAADHVAQPAEFELVAQGPCRDSHLAGRLFAVVACLLQPEQEIGVVKLAKNFVGGLFVTRLKQGLGP